MKKMTKYQKRMLKLILGSVIYFLIMFLGATASGYLLSSELEGSVPFLVATFISVIGLLIYKILLGKKKLPDIIRHSIGILIFLTLSILSFFVTKGLGFISLIGILYAISLVVDRTFSIVKKKTKRHIVIAIIAYVYAFLFLLIYLAVLGSEDQGSTILSFTPLSIVVTSFVGVMRLIFSGLRGKTLIQIIRKTYAIEILYGLLTLIFATAIMLSLTEESFQHYGDALWYCFSVVTTVGFGDIVATTLIGRLLTVILGIYGIIVVALITSIIVNLYNETSHNKRDEVIEEELKKLEEERKPIDNPSSKKEDK